MVLSQWSLIPAVQTQVRVFTFLMLMVVDQSEIVCNYGRYLLLVCFSDFFSCFKDIGIIADYETLFHFQPVPKIYFPGLIVR